MEYIFNMNIWMPIIITSIAGLATLVGNVFLFVPIRYKDRLISFAFGLSFVVMFLISILELIPDGLFLVRDYFSLLNLFIYGILLLIVGYILVVILDREIDSNNKLFKIGILSMLSLLLHNIPEGIICTLGGLNDINLGFKMSFMIMIHNIPEGICISLPIYYATKSRGRAILYTLISSMGEIVGALLTVLFLYKYINNLILSIVFIITAGIMITLSILKIFKEGFELKKYKYLTIGIIVGIIIIIVTL